MSTITVAKTKQELELSAYRRTIKKVEKMVLGNDLQGLMSRLRPCEFSSNRFEKKKWLEAERAVELAARLDQVEMVELIGKLYGQHPHLGQLAEVAMVQATRASHVHVVEQVARWNSVSSKVITRCLEVASKNHDHETIKVLLDSIQSPLDVVKASLSSSFMEIDDPFGAQNCFRQCFSTLVARLSHEDVQTTHDMLSSSPWANEHLCQVRTRMQATLLEGQTPQTATCKIKRRL